MGSRWAESRRKAAGVRQQPRHARPPPVVAAAHRAAACRASACTLRSPPPGKRGEATMAELTADARPAQLPRHARLGRRIGHAPPQQPVDQRALAHVGEADDHGADGAGAQAPSAALDIDLLAQRRCLPQHLRSGGGQGEKGGGVFSQPGLHALPRLSSLPWQLFGCRGCKSGIEQPGSCHAASPSLPAKPCLAVLLERTEPQQPPPPRGGGEPVAPKASAPGPPCSRPAPPTPSPQATEPSPPAARHRPCCRLSTAPRGRAPRRSASRPPGRPPQPCPSG